MATEAVYTIGSYTVHLETIEGCEGELTCEGWEYRRNAKVEGLLGTGLNQVPTAVTVLAQVPVTPPLIIGSYLPGLTDCRLERIRPRSRSVGVCELQLLYKERYGFSVSNNNVFRLRYGGTSEETNVDVTGNPLAVAYNGQTQNATTSRLVPNPDLSVVRVEYADPKPVAQTYATTVNQGGTPWDPTAQDRCWLCSGIEIESHDRNISYTVTYNFKYKPPIQQANSNNNTPYAAGWDKELIYRLPDGTAPLHLHQSNNGVKPRMFYQVYPSVSFAGLARGTGAQRRSGLPRV